MTTKNIEKRYLRSWEYNGAHILTELETIVKNNGGAVCTTWQYGDAPKWLKVRKLYEIENRTLSGAIREKEELLKRLETLGRTEAAKATRDEIEQYKKINNEPVISYYGDYLYIGFVLDGYYYYFSMDKNPFFDFNFAKVKVERGNKIKQNYYLKGDPKEWWNDCFWRFTCSASDRREAANLIFNMLITADASALYYTANRKPYTNIIFLED